MPSGSIQQSQEGLDSPLTNLTKCQYITGGFMGAPPTHTNTHEEAEKTDVKQRRKLRKSTPWEVLGHPGACTQRVSLWP